MEDWFRSCGDRRGDLLNFNADGPVETVTTTSVPFNLREIGWDRSDCTI